MLNNLLNHWYIPQTRPAHIHTLLVLKSLTFDVGTDVREAADAVDACCAFEEVDCFCAVGGLGGEGPGGKGFGGGEEVRGVGVGVGVVYVVLNGM